MSKARRVQLCKSLNPEVGKQFAHFLNAPGVYELRACFTDLLGGVRRGVRRQALRGLLRGVRRVCIRRRARLCSPSSGGLGISRLPLCRVLLVLLPELLRGVRRVILSSLGDIIRRGRGSTAHVCAGRSRVLLELLGVELLSRGLLQRLPKLVILLLGRELLRGLLRRVRGVKHSRRRALLPELLRGWRGLLELLRRCRLRDGVSEILAQAACVELPALHLVIDLEGVAQAVYGLHKCGVGSHNYLLIHGVFSSFKFGLGCPG